MGKKKRKKPDHPLLREPDTLSVGKQIALQQLWSDYMLPEMERNGRRPSTIKCIERAINLWNSWWNEEGAKGVPLPIATIGIQHLNRFREWLGRLGASIPKQNYNIGAIRQALLCAESNLLISHAPKIKRLQHSSVSPKIIFTTEDVEKIWNACSKARWPKVDRDGLRLPCDTPTVWRCAVVLYWTYGFRTQELIANETGFRSLKWSEIHEPGLTPNPVGRESCEWGWLRYVPQKQQRMKPEPLTNPLTMHARAAIEWLRYSRSSHDTDVFNLPLSSVSFYHEWQHILDVADIRPRAGSGVENYLIKHFRKTATTVLDDHTPGAGAAIVGHASDRSGQRSVISDKHYRNAEQMVCKCLATLPTPECFDDLLSCML